MGDKSGNGGRTFRLDRLSPEATRLKSAVVRKIQQFLADYDDDILAEYIVVLVCNGKTEAQTTDDLREFLHDDSQIFVHWLWDFLSREIFPCNPNNTRLERELPNTADKPSQQPADSDYSCRPSTTFGDSPSLSKLQTTKQFADPFHSPQEFVTLAQSFKRLSNNSRGPTSRLSGDGEPHLFNPDNKVAKRKPNGSPSQALLVPEDTPILRSHQAHIGEEFRGSSNTRTIGGGRKHSINLGAGGQKVQRRRGSVWDRLGKPCTDYDTVPGEKKGHGIGGVVKRGKLELSNLQCQSSECAAPYAKADKYLYGGSTATVRSNDKFGSSNCIGEMSAPACTPIIPFDDDSSRHNLEFHNGNLRKNFKKKNSMVREAGQEVESHINCETTQKVNGDALDVERSVPLYSESGQHSEKPAASKLKVQTNDWSTHQARRGFQVEYSMQKPMSSSKSAVITSEPPSNTEGGNASQRLAQDEVLDLKLRLRQIESEMLKLRSKETQMGSDMKQNSISGERNHSEEDIDSRTVLVTNVHYGASQETVLAHFAMCGIVVKVVLLRDPVTAKPKGAAYVTFASRESVDKALSLSGTSLHLRTLTVMRKADAPAGLIAPIYPLRKVNHNQPWASLVQKKVRTQDISYNG